MSGLQLACKSRRIWRVEMTEDMSAFKGQFTLLPLSHANVQNKWSVISDICLRLQGQDNLRFGAKLAIGLTTIKEMFPSSTRMFQAIGLNVREIKGHSPILTRISQCHQHTSTKNIQITPFSKAPKEKRWGEACQGGNHLILAMSCCIWGIDQVFFKRVYIFTIQCLKVPITSLQLH